MELAIFLFVVGVLLVVLEALIPSFGLITVMAVGAFGLSVWRAYSVSPAAAVIMGVTAPLLTVAILYFGIKYLPRTSWGRGLVLRDPAEDGTQLPPTASETAAVTAEGGTSEATLRKLVGAQGVAKSDLRPVGIVVIDGHRVDCVTEGAMIEQGARVTVVAVQGNHVVVRQVKV